MATKMNHTVLDLRFDIEKQLEAENAFIERKSASRASRASREPEDIFAWRDVAFSVDMKGGKKQILQNVSGYVEKGIFMRSTISKCRSIAGHYGTIWMWENDSFEHPFAKVKGRVSGGTPISEWFCR